MQNVDAAFVPPRIGKWRRNTNTQNISSLKLKLLIANEPRVRCEVKRGRSLRAASLKVAPNHLHGKMTALFRL